MRILALVFVALIVALQYPMWLGKGGWLSVRELDRQLDTQQATNAALKARNEALDADVGDLKTGYEAIEERARAELGMVRSDEVMFQVQPAGNRTAPPPPPKGPGSAAVKAPAKAPRAPAATTAPSEALPVPPTGMASPDGPSPQPSPTPPGTSSAGPAAAPRSAP